MLALSTMAFFDAGCGGKGAPGSGSGSDTPPDDGSSQLEEEESVEGEVLVGVRAYPDAAIEAKIAAVGTIIQVNEVGAVYRVKLNDGVTLEQAQAALASLDTLYVEKNYLAHPFAASADPNDTKWAAQYGTAVTSELKKAWGAWAAGSGVGAPVAVKASGWIDSADLDWSQATGDTVTVAGTPFVAGDGTGGTFDCGTFGSTNLKNAINAASLGVTATLSGNTRIVITATAGGAAGNAITLDATGSTHISVSGATLTGGSDAKQPITIAVIDSGVDCAHEDLANKCAAGRDVIASADRAATYNSDDVGHGTEVAGVAAAESGNSKGIAGIAATSDPTAADPLAVNVVPVKVSSATIPANHALIAKGIDWAANTLSPHADVILISMGSISPSYTLKKSIENAWSKGCLVVAAAGNTGTSLMRYPAAYRNSSQNVLSVTHVDQADALVPGTTAGSNYGSWVDVAAPGTDIITTETDASVTNKYTDGSSGPAKVAGSSYGAAYVAGAAALLWSAHPTFTNADVRNLLASSVETYDRAAGKNITAAGGRLNIDRAMLMATAKTAVDVAGLVLSASSARGGSTVTGTVVLLNADPANDVTVTLASSNSTVASVASSVTVPKGATSATFPITTTAVTANATATISASKQGGAAALGAVLTVSAPQVKSLACTPAAPAVGQPVTCTVTLDSTPASGGVAITIGQDQGTTTPDTGTATLPNLNTATITASAKTFTVTPTGAGTITIGAKGAAQASYVNAPTITAQGPSLKLTLKSLSVTGGAQVTGTVTFNYAVAADTTVTISSDHTTEAPLPTTMPVVLSGKTSASFTIATTAPASKVTASIGATGATLTATSVNLDILPDAVKSVAFSASSCIAGGSLTGTVTLATSAAIATPVALSASSEVVALSASSITVGQNSSTQTFTVSCNADVEVSTAVIISAQTSGTAAKTGTVTVLPVLAGVSIVNAQGTVITSLASGSAANVKITLNGTPASPVSVAVSATLPSTAGSVTAAPTFSGLSSGAVSVSASTDSSVGITANGSISGPIAVSATYAGVTKSVTLKVVAPTVQTVACDVAYLATTSDTATCTVTLSANMPAATTMSVAVTPATPTGITIVQPVAVAGGAKTTTFTVAPSTTPAANSTLTLTVTANKSSKTVSILVNPVKSVTLASPGLTGGLSSTTATVTLFAKAPAGGQVVNLSTNTASAISLPGATITVAAGSATGTFTVNTKPLASDATGVTISANGKASASFTVGKTIASAALVGGTSPAVTNTVHGTLRITFAAPIPAAGLSVTYASSATGKATISPTGATAETGAATSRDLDMTPVAAGSTDVTVTIGGVVVSTTTVTVGS